MITMLDADVEVDINEDGDDVDVDDDDDDDDVDVMFTISLYDDDDQDKENAREKGSRKNDELGRIRIASHFEQDENIHSKSHLALCCPQPFNSCIFLRLF